jgi:hypothetical protein
MPAVPALVTMFSRPWLRTGPAPEAKTKPDRFWIAVSTPSSRRVERPASSTRTSSMTCSALRTFRAEETAPGA